MTQALLGLLATVKPTLSPLPVTVAQSLPTATSPRRLCIPHHHQQLPPEDPSYATWCHTPSSDDNQGPKQGTEHGISRVFPLGTPALCYLLSLKAQLQRPGKQSIQSICLLPSALPARISPLTISCTKSGARPSQHWSNHLNCPCLLQRSVK